MKIIIVPNDKANPPGKLADVELHFTLTIGVEAALQHEDEPGMNAEAALGGLKLIGFAVWERRTGAGRNVTFPARQYSVNGERRSFALLRPIGDATAQDRIRELILAAYATYEQDGTSGQDREAYTDSQDRRSYVPDVKF